MQLFHTLNSMLLLHVFMKLRIVICIVHICICTYIYIYYTTLLKSVQITRKTSTNIQRYSDSWLFVYFRFDKSFLTQPRPQGHRGRHAEGWITLVGAAGVSGNLGDFGWCGRMNFRSILIETTPAVQLQVSQSDAHLVGGKENSLYCGGEASPIFGHAIANFE